jgi:hypothetical protein
MKLMHELEYKPGPRRYPERLTPESLSRITKWCEEHGPLGILLSQWEAIRLAPVANASGNFARQVFVRGPGQQIQDSSISEATRTGRARVLLHELIDITPRNERPGQTWGKFFPAVSLGKKDTFQYPIPYSDEFCSLYAERVFDFCQAARLLTGAMLHLQRSTQPPVENPDLARGQALETINLLRRSVSSVLEFDKEENPIAVWESPSLLASFAEMYVQDLMYGRPALTCACCGAPFVSDAYQAQFCSLACRYRGQKRRLRQQMRHAKLMHGAGKSAKQIAAKLDQDPDVVARWLAKL